MGSTEEYIKDTVSPIASAEVLEVETIEQKIVRYADLYGIASSSLYNLVECESKFNSLADNGEDRGIVQINRKHHPEITDEQAFDPDWALNWAAKEISEGRGYQWVCGNCYLTALLKVKTLPRMSNIEATSNIPRVGGLAVFYYNGEKHIGVVEKVYQGSFDLFEGNKHAFKIEVNNYKFNDPNLRGFVSYKD